MALSSISADQPNMGGLNAYGPNSSVSSISVVSTSTTVPGTRKDIARRARHVSSSLPVPMPKSTGDSQSQIGHAPSRRPAAEVIDQVHRRLSGTYNVQPSSSSPQSSIPLFRVPTNGPSSRASAPQQRPTQHDHSGDHHHHHSNRPLLSVETPASTSFINPKSRRRSVVLSSTASGIRAVENHPLPNGTPQSTLRSSRGLLSQPQTTPLGSSRTNRQGARDVNIPRLTRPSVSPVPRVQYPGSIPPVPPLPLQMHNNLRRRPDARPRPNPSVTASRPVRSLSSSVLAPTAATRARVVSGPREMGMPHRVVSSSEKMTGNHPVTTMRQITGRPPPRRLVSGPREMPASLHAQPAHGNLGQSHATGELHRHQPSGSSAVSAGSSTSTKSSAILPIAGMSSMSLSEAHNGISRSQTLPDMAQFDCFDAPSPKKIAYTQHPLSAKSPYRPLNVPAKIYPRANYENQVPTTASPNAVNRSGSHTGDPSHSSDSMRPKSTVAIKQWSTDRKGQPSAAATRRMLLSPFESFRRISRVTVESRGFEATPEQLMSPSVSSRTSSVELREETDVRVTPRKLTDKERNGIRTIMKSLVCCKPGEETPSQVMQALKKQGDVIVEPMSPAVAAKSAKLNLYEKGEILDFRRVYFAGHPDARKVIGNVRRTASNFGYDDDKGDYKVTIGDHIAYRYRILSVLGKGSFGKVLKCLDYKTGSLVALKLIINRRKLHIQALIESELMKSLCSWDRRDQFHFARYLDHFTFREHLCISSELLGINLYELIKYNSYKGLPVALTKHFTRQLLESLAFLDSKGIIHCDLKPENIMLCDAESGRIKLIDFGSSCYENERIYTYIQSRFYRSPEVMLGMTYGRPVDIWSIGCIVPELLTGRPLFMGENEQEQISCIMEVCGVPAKQFIERCSRRRHFFDSSGTPRPVQTKRESRGPGSRPLSRALRSDDADLLDFLDGLLTWDPLKRMGPVDALKHPFLSGGET